VKQEFYKYPKPQYNFNYVDQLISGDQTELRDFTKYRRLLFNIVPPKVTSAEEESAFAEALNQFAAHLNKDKMIPDDPAEDSPPVSFSLRRKFPERVPGVGDHDGVERKAAATSGHQQQAEATPAVKPTGTRRRFPEFSSRGGGSKATTAQALAAEAGRRPSGGIFGEGQVGAAEKSALGASEGGEMETAAAPAAAIPAAIPADRGARDDGPT
ncbi:unnamed protein product, partial [Hapterophycus canaliculatus]